MDAPEKLRLSPPPVRCVTVLGLFVRPSGHKSIWHNGRNHSRDTKSFKFFKIISTFYEVCFQFSTQNVKMIDIRIGVVHMKKTPFFEN